MSYTSELAALRADLKRIELKIDAIKLALSVAVPPAPPAQAIGPYPEIRPQNAVANGRMPTAAELAAFKAKFVTEHQWFSPYAEKVTGAFTGTTEEILEWAAVKWGLDPDICKAVAVQESNWRQDTVGDAGESYSIVQVRRGVWGGFPLTRDSTPFACDICMAHLKCWLDGNGWRPLNPAGSLKEALECWFDPSAFDRQYADAVLGFLQSKPWRQSGF